MSYKILATNSEKGFAIVTDDSFRLRAFVNGKYYDVMNFRPIDGDGRQLRDDTRNAIKAMLPAVLDENEKLKTANAANVGAAKRITELETEVNRLKELKTLERPSFADTLQDKFLGVLAGMSADTLAEQIFPTVEKAIVDKFGLVPVVHEIRLPERPPVEIKERLHKDFDRIFQMVACGEPVYMVGEAGTGKSFLAQQIAKALDVEYYYTNSVTDDVQIKGFIDANGRYHETQFYKAFTGGGVFLLDELDASVEEAVILLNNALANGYFDFPTGRAQAHKDFRAIAAGNTFGTGANLEYTGRARLDAASLDRFSVVSVDYDKDVEMDISGNNRALVEFVEDFRAAAKKAGVSCLCTYRAIKRMAKFDSFMSKADNIRASLTKGLKADDIQYICQKMTISNDWTAALNTLAK